MPTKLFRHLALTLLTTFFLAPPLQAADAMDELTRQVARYELTLPKIEAYGAVMSGLAEWATANPKEIAALNQRLPKKLSDIKVVTAFIEQEPVIANTLQRHGLSSVEYFLIPMATLQAGIAALGVQQGQVFPADRINPKNIALVQAHQTRIDAIVTKARADQAKMMNR